MVVEVVLQREGLGLPVLLRDQLHGQPREEVVVGGVVERAVVGQAKQYTTNANMFELTRLGVDSQDTITIFANKLNNP